MFPDLIHTVKNKSKNVKNDIYPLDFHPISPHKALGTRKG